MRKSATLGAIVALGLGTTAIAAEGPNHTHVEGGYGYSELAGGLADGDGFKVGGSIQLPGNVIASASYRDFTFEEGGDDADISEISAGLAYRWALGESFDLLTGASFEQIDMEGLLDESGFGLNLGLVGRLTDKVEVAGGLSYVDISEIPSSFTVSLGVRRYITPGFAIGLDVRKSDILMLASETSFIATLRYDFGKLFQ